MQKQESCFERKHSSAIEIPENKQRIAYGRVGKIEEPLGQRAMVGQVYKFATYGIASRGIAHCFVSIVLDK